MFEPPTHHNGIKILMNSQKYFFHYIYMGMVCHKKSSQTSQKLKICHKNSQKKIITKSGKVQVQTRSMVLWLKVKKVRKIKTCTKNLSQTSKKFFKKVTKMGHGHQKISSHKFLKNRHKYHQNSSQTSQKFVTKFHQKNSSQNFVTKIHDLHQKQLPRFKLLHCSEQKLPLSIYFPFSTPIYSMYELFCPISLLLMIRKYIAKSFLIRLQKTFYPIVLYLAASNIYRWHSSTRIGHLFFCCVQNTQTRLKGLSICKALVFAVIV